MQSTIFDNVTDHAVVKAILSALNLHNWKHVCYWSKLFGNRIKNINIIHHSGKQNLNSDWQPVLPASPTHGLNEEVQFLPTCSSTDLQFNDQQLQPVTRDGIL